MAACWTARGCFHAAQLASAFSKTTTPIPARPRYNPIGLASSVPTTIWFMLRMNPVSTTMVTCPITNTMNVHMMMKWIDRPICRLPDSFGHHGNRTLKDGDIDEPVIIAKGATTNTTPKYESCWSAL